jgi:replicative DNA helicase
MQYGELFLSRVIDQNEITALTRFGITEADLPTEGERQALRFIQRYADENGGSAPSYATVTGECEHFTYVPAVEDSFEYMARQIKQNSAKHGVKELFEGGELSKKFQELDGNYFAEWLLSEVESIKIRTSVRTTVGTSVKDNASKFKAEYEQRKSGESFRVWQSKFPVINKAIGGYTSSNVYVVYGKSGRGKSAVTLEEAVELAWQGANVLIWLMEMGWYEGMVRIYTSISARVGISNAEINGVNMEAGFDSRELRHGKLNEDFERSFMDFLDAINGIVPGNITLRAVDDDDFNRRDLRQLEADILQTSADVVVVDPFYYFDYERNTSKTAGGDAAQTSKGLRRLAGKTKTVVFALTQAEEVDNAKDEDGVRELRMPQRSEVKKTKALLEDASLLIAVDTNAKEGRGLIGINKGRDGGEGEFAEIIYLPQIGVIKELETGSASVAQFTKQF